RYVDGAVSPSAPAKKEAGGLTVAQLMSFLDKNGDDRISEDEASAELKPNFGYLDTNGDGGIDRKEAEVIVQYANQGGSR
ncbi:MAG: hypothetical protein AAF989_14220, partial [Planctomycetota bacterium]